MPMDWGNVSWVYVTVLAVFVFLCSLLGNLLGFRHRVRGSVFSALLFAAVFVFWTWYPHNLPLPTRPGAAVPAPAAAGPAASREPSGRFEDVTRPRPNQ